MSKEKLKLSHDDQAEIVADMWAEGAGEAEIAAHLEDSVESPIGRNIIRDAMVEAEKEAMRLGKKETDYWKGLQLARSNAVYRKAMKRGEIAAANQAVKLQAALTGTIQSDDDKRITLNVLQLAHLAAQQEKELRDRVAVNPIADTASGMFTEKKDMQMAAAIPPPPAKQEPAKRTTSGPFGGETHFRG